MLQCEKCKSIHQVRLGYISCLRSRKVGVLITPDFFSSAPHQKVTECSGIHFRDELSVSCVCMAALRGCRHGNIFPTKSFDPEVTSCPRFSTADASNFSWLPLVSKLHFETRDGTGYTVYTNKVLRYYISLIHFTFLYCSKLKHSSRVDRALIFSNCLLR